MATKRHRGTVNGTALLLRVTFCAQNETHEVENYYKEFDKSSVLFIVSEI